jgi:hypothetical protein
MKWTRVKFEKRIEDLGGTPYHIAKYFSAVSFRGLNRPANYPTRLKLWLQYTQLASYRTYRCFGFARNTPNRAWVAGAVGYRFGRTEIVARTLSMWGGTCMEPHNKRAIAAGFVARMFYIFECGLLTR